MNFNSIAFLIYLPIVLLVYWILPFRFRWIWLLVASYYFYGSWNPILLLLILMTTMVSYFAAILIEKYPKRKKVFLSITLVVCLGTLFAFKYLEFSINSIIDLLRVFSLPLSHVSLNILLPVGISFYTFQTLSYVIDVYRGDYKAEHHFGYYALFISYFPQLVAGPIESPSILLPQLKKEQHVSVEDMLSGTRLLISGFFRKCVIADFLGTFVNQGFSNLTSLNSLSVLLVGALFCIQMYCDFAGYSEIAMGCARMMGVRLTQNFAQPYLSESYGEFFHRWHYSLNRWFTDYLYIPLGGNRKGKARETLNKMIVFALCGLWHGARWNYLLWGLYAGFFVSMESLLINPWLKKKAGKGFNLKSPEIVFLRRCIMFLIFIPAALLFRATSFQDISLLFSSLFTKFGFGITYFSSSFSLLGISLKDALMILLLLFILYYLYYFAYPERLKEKGRPNLEPVLIKESGEVQKAEKKEVSIKELLYSSLPYAYGVLLIALMWIYLSLNQDTSGFAYFQF